jgi:hypothetical protein
VSRPDDDARLERRYRCLLLAYPMEFRRDRGEEVVSTLLDAANRGQTAPSLVETCDLVYNGIRTRARRTRVTLTGPVAADAFLHTGLLTLALATATALAVTVGVSVLGQEMFPSAGSSHGAYPLAVRVALGLLLGSFPAALVVTRAGRPRLARQFVALGAAGSVGFGSWLMVHALGTGSEILQPSKVFSLVVVLCLPAAMLARSPATELPRQQLRRVVLFASLLTITLGGLVASRALVAATTYAEASGYDYYAPRYGVLAETRIWQGMGLWQGMGAALVAIWAWHLFRALSRRRQPQDLLVSVAMTIPALSYVIGNLVTHMLEQPGVAAGGDLGEDLLMVVVWSAVVLLLAVLAVGALRRLAQPKRNGWSPDARLRST